MGDTWFSVCLNEWVLTVMVEKGNIFQFGRLVKNVGFGTLGVLA